MKTDIAVHLAFRLWPTHDARVTDLVQQQKLSSTDIA